MYFSAKNGKTIGGTSTRFQIVADYDLQNEVKVTGQWQHIDLPAYREAYPEVGRISEFTPKARRNWDGSTAA
jgi:hypothetical protein